ncbi:hypothetical protein Tco_0104835 [Tanacetum coccineum]
MVVKEEEEKAIKKVKGEALKEKNDPGAFIFPIRLEGREEMKKVDRGITMINHTQAEAMGILTNVLCQVGVTTLIAKFMILDILIDRAAPIVAGRGFLHTIGGIVNTPETLFSTFDGFCHQTFRAAGSDVLRTAKSNSDDEEEYEIKRNKFVAPIYGPKPGLCLNCNNPTDRLSAIQTVINPFRKISVWKKAVSFLDVGLGSGVDRGHSGDGSGCCNEISRYMSGNLREFGVAKNLKSRLKHQILDILPTKHTNGKRTMGGNDNEAGLLRPKRSRQFETVEEVLLPKVHHKFLLWEGCNRDAKMGCDGEVDEILRIKLREVRYNEEIFTFVAWIRAFNINEPIYLELCHEFYSTYEFDKVCVDDELQTKKIIKFKLYGRGHNLTLLEFARRLGLYHANKLDEEGFNVYFEGGLQNDEQFNAQEYWLSISREENLSLSRSLASTIRCPILRVTPKWVCECGLVNYKVDKEKKELDGDTSGGSKEDGGAYNPLGYAQPQYDQYYQQYPPPPQYPQYHQQQCDQDDE